MLTHGVSLLDIDDRRAYKNLSAGCKCKIAEILQQQLAEKAPLSTENATVNKRQQTEFPRAN